jgi:hypothetical protein
MDTLLETPAAEKLPTHSVNLVKNGEFFEVTCPECQQVIYHAHSERAAYLNAGKVGEHAKECPGHQ